MGMRDSWAARKVYKDVDANVGRAVDKPDAGRRPLRKYEVQPVYHPVTLNPTGEPSYIDGQVIDIIHEIHQEGPLRPFIEGEPIGSANARRDNPGMFIMGIPLRDFNLMSDRVWRDHRAKTKAAQRTVYTTVRTAAGIQFLWTWRPETSSFHTLRGEVK